MDDVADAVDQALNDADPGHAWHVTFGETGDPPVPMLRIDRTGPEALHPMINIGPLPRGQFPPTEPVFIGHVVDYCLAMARALDQHPMVQQAPTWQGQAAEAFADTARAKRPKREPMDAPPDCDGSGRPGLVLRGLNLTECSECDSAFDPHEVGAGARVPRHPAEHHPRRSDR